MEEFVADRSRDLGHRTAGVEGEQVQGCRRANGREAGQKQVVGGDLLFR
jgi:hypothetical protein